MISSLLERLGYKLALRRMDRRTVVSLPDALADRQLFVMMPRNASLIEGALNLVSQVELSPDQIRLAWLDTDIPADVSVGDYRMTRITRDDFDWFRLPSGGTCEEVYTPRPHVAIDLSPDFVLSSAYLVGRSPAVFRMGVHHTEAEPFRDIMIRYDGEPREAYLALRRILYNIEPAILPMQPMSTRVFY